MMMLTTNDWLDVFNSLITPTKTQKLDLSKDEDYEKVTSLINEAREASNKLGSFGKMFFGDSLGELIDELETSAKNIHDKAKTNDEENSPVRPSTNVEKNIKNNIKNLVDEYTNTYIMPYADSNNLSKKQIESAKDGLLEFACWMYSKK